MCQRADRCNVIAGTYLGVRDICHTSLSLSLSPLTGHTLTGKINIENPVSYNESKIISTTKTKCVTSIVCRLNIELGIETRLKCRTPIGIFINRIILIHLFRVYLNVAFQLKMTFWQQTQSIN